MLAVLRAYPYSQNMRRSADGKGEQEDVFFARMIARAVGEGRVPAGSARVPTYDEALRFSYEQAWLKIDIYNLHARIHIYVNCMHACQ